MQAHLQPAGAAAKRAWGPLHFQHTWTDYWWSYYDVSLLFFCNQSRAARLVTNLVVQYTCKAPLFLIQPLRSAAACKHAHIACCVQFANVATCHSHHCATHTANSKHSLNIQGKGQHPCMQH